VSLPGTSWAVVIGINAYQHPEIPALSYAVNDARSVAAALRGLGSAAERIFLLTDTQATRQGIETVLYDRLRAAGTNDRLFVFFAGHGETVALPRGQAQAREDLATLKKSRGGGTRAVESG
jgi:uncharacterized caspase-like protein